MARRARQALRGYVESSFTDLSENTSLRFMLGDEVYGGDYLGMLPMGGYRALLAPLAAGLVLRLSWPVASVSQSDVGVTVTAADGRVETGSHVIVTVPLGVLQAGIIGFDPPLTGERQAVIARQGFSSIEKVGLAFKEPFWREDGPPMLISCYPGEPNMARCFFLDSDHAASPPTLMLFVPAGTAGPAILDRSPQEAVAWARNLLADVTASDIPEPLDSWVSNWRTDPYSRGSVSHVPPGQDLADMDIMAMPVRRIQFAGEHTDSRRVGFADGAMLSGVREAKRLLRTASVALTAFTTA